MSASFAIQETTFQEDLFDGYRGSTALNPDGSLPTAPSVIPGFRVGDFVEGEGYEIFEDIEGNDLGNTPFLTVNVDADYTYDAWTFSLGGKYNDDVYVNTLNTQPLDDYFVFEGAISYTGKEGTALEGWKASLNIYIIFDEQIWLARSYTDDTGQVLADRGRQISATITASF